jgi:cellulase (glycosyl hydrolase family 5)
VASAFLENPNVIFDVYNEPTTKNLAGGNLKNPGELDWTVWQRGGTVGTTPVIGMQALVDAIRSTGAKQIVAVDALRFSTTFRGIGNHLIHDRNLVYEIHPYFGVLTDGGNLTREQWDANFGFLAKRFPVYAGEWGLFPSAHYETMAGRPIHPRLPSSQAAAEVETLLRYFDSRHMSWTAFAFGVSPQGLMLANWDGFVPTSFARPWRYEDLNPAVGMGEVVKRYLTRHRR